MSTHRQTHRSFRNHTRSHSSSNYRNHQQRQQQRSYNPHNAPRRPNFRAPYNHDHEDDDHEDEENEDDNDDDVLKYLKIRTHHAPAEDEIDPEVVATDVEPNICGICQHECKHEENIGALQCEHEYHTDCIKQWLLRKKDCPICRASVLPSQK